MLKRDLTIKLHYVRVVPKTVLQLQLVLLKADIKDAQWQKDVAYVLENFQGCKGFLPIK